LLSAFTAAAAKQPYAFVDLGEVDIRGKSQPVRVFGLKDGD
jgi:class 3 adenylate cyclase